MAIGPGSKMQATFRNAADGKEVTLKLRGSILENSAQITYNDIPVAQITKKLITGREMFSGKQIGP